MNPAHVSTQGYILHRDQMPALNAETLSVSLISNCLKNAIKYHCYDWVFFAIGQILGGTSVGQILGGFYETTSGFLLDPSLTAISVLAVKLSLVLL